MVSVKKNDQHKKIKWYAAPLVVLLAVLCIGGVELAVCAHFDPALYHSITDPVYTAVQTGVRWAAETGQAAWNSLCQTADAAAVRLQAAWDELTAPPPEPPPEADLQLVDSETVTAPPRPRAEYTVTALENRDGQDILIGGTREVVYFDQTSERWAGEPYGSDHIGGYGCGPTAMAMVASTLTGQEIDPAQMAQYCVEQGYWARLHGSYLSMVPGVSEDFGLECVSLPPEEASSDLVTQHLAAGQLIVALMGPGHFTNGGHFIVLRGVTLEGSILVADPASQERSLTTWDLELILEELSASRHSGSPLWIISPKNF